MAVYLIKDRNRQTKFGLQETISFLEGLGFEDTSSHGDYDHPDGQYVALSKIGGNQIQTQNLKSNTMAGLIRILQPKFFLDDAARVHNLSELNLEE